MYKSITIEALRISQYLTVQIKAWPKKKFLNSWHFWTFDPLMVISPCIVELKSQQLPYFTSFFTEMFRLPFAALGSLQGSDSASSMVVFGCQVKVKEMWRKGFKFLLQASLQVAPRWHCLFLISLDDPGDVSKPIRSPSARQNPPKPKGAEASNIQGGKGSKPQGENSTDQ